MQLKDDNYKMWLQGAYFVSALNSSVGNMFKKKGAKAIEYEKEPFDIFAEKHLVITDEMTEDEKLNETNKLFNMLFDMQNQFEKSKGR